MRKQKIVKIKIDEKTEREITVFEVRPADILAKIDEAERAAEDRSLADVLRDALPLLTDATEEDLEGFYPSDIEDLWRAFKEVNGPFLRIVQAAGLDTVIAGLKSLIVAELSAFASGLLGAAIHTATSSTDTV